MTKREFSELSYLEKKFYINSKLNLRFGDMAKIHNRTESAIVQALKNQIPTLHKKIIESKYMGLE